MNSNFLRLLFIIAAATAILPGIILIIAPQTVMSIYGLQLDAAGTFAARMQGVLPVGLAVVYWFARNAAGQSLQTAVLLAGLLTNAVTTLIVAISTANGTLNAAGWPAMALHAALAIGFAYALARVHRSAS